MVSAITSIVSSLVPIVTTGMGFLVSSGIGQSLLGAAVSMGSSLFGTAVSAGSSLASLAISKGTELVSNWIATKVSSGESQKGIISGLLDNIKSKLGIGGSNTTTKTQTTASSNSNVLENLSKTYDELKEKFGSGIEGLSSYITSVVDSLKNLSGISKVDIEELDEFASSFGISISNIKEFFEKYKIDLDSIKSFLSGGSDSSIEESVQKITELIDYISSYSDTVKSNVLKVIENVKNTDSKSEVSSKSNSPVASASLNSIPTLNTYSNRSGLNLNTSWFNNSLESLTYAKKLAVQNGRNEMSKSYSSPQNMINTYTGTKYSKPAVGRIMLVPANTNGANSIGHAAYVIESNADYIVVKESNWGDGAAVTENTRKIYLDNIDSSVIYV